MRKFLLLCEILIVLAVIAVWTCPADFAYRWFASRLGAVTLSDLSGTIWSGHATSVSVLGHEIGSLDWQLHALPLLRGEVAAQIDVQGAQGSVQALLTARTDRTIEAQEVRANLPVAVLEPALAVPDLHLVGQVEINLSRARIRDGWLVAADGSAFWHDAAVSSATQARLGDLRATFATQPEEQVGGEVHDLGGPLIANGKFQIEAADYSGEATLAARDGDPHVLDALQHVGQPQADGSVFLKVRGHMDKLY